MCKVDMYNRCGGDGGGSGGDERWISQLLSDVTIYCNTIMHESCVIVSCQVKIMSRKMSRNSTRWDGGMETERS